MADSKEEENVPEAESAVNEDQQSPKTHLIDRDDNLKETKSECVLLSSSNSALKFITMMYNEISSSSSSSETEDEEEEDIIKDATYSLQALNCDEDDNDDDDNPNQSGVNRKYGYPMVSGEIDYRDLPPPENTAAPTLSPFASLSPIGRVLHTIEELTIIESYVNKPPIGEGTLFWSHDGEYAGELFDTMGPVKKPFYTIRVTPIDTTLVPGQEVFVASDDKELTKFIFTDDLMKDKGCDASWKDDYEIPPELREPSDDEEEKKKHGRREGGKNKKNLKNVQRRNNTNQRYGRNALLPPSVPFPPPLSFPVPPPPPFSMSSIPFNGYSLPPLPSPPSPLSSSVPSPYLPSVRQHYDGYFNGGELSRSSVPLASPTLSPSPLPFCPLPPLSLPSSSQPHNVYSYYQ